MLRLIYFFFFAAFFAGAFLAAFFVAFLVAIVSVLPIDFELQSATGFIAANEDIDLWNFTVKKNLMSLQFFFE